MISQIKKITAILSFLAVMNVFFSVCFAQSTLEYMYGYGAAASRNQSASPPPQTQAQDLSSLPQNSPEEWQQKDESFTPPHKTLPLSFYFLKSKLFLVCAALLILMIVYLKSAF